MSLTMMGVGQAGNIFVPPSNSLWTCDEGSGATVTDNKGISNLTQNLCSWGTGYIDITGTVANEYVNEAVANYPQMDSFSVALWWKCNTLGLNLSFLLNGTGGSAATYNFRLTSDGTDNTRVNAQVSDGTTANQVQTATGAINTTDRFFTCITYQRVGGASNNVWTMHHTKDGVTWDRPTSSTTLLMQKLAGSTFRSKGTLSSAFGLDIRWYKLEVFNGAVLTNDQVQELYNRSSGDF